MLLVTSPPTEVQKGGHGDDTVYITLYSIWTGIDSGPFTKYVEAIILYTFITPFIHPYIPFFTICIPMYTRYIQYMYHVYT